MAKNFDLEISDIKELIRHKIAINGIDVEIGAIEDKITDAGLMSQFHEHAKELNDCLMRLIENLIDAKTQAIIDKE